MHHILNDGKKLVEICLDWNHICKHLLLSWGKNLNKAFKNNLNNGENICRGAIII